VHWALAVVALTLLAFAAISGRIAGTPITAPMVFTAIGLLVGSEALGLIDVAPAGETVKLLAEATLALVLFADASRIDVHALRGQLSVPLRLLGIGLPLTLLGGFVVALVVFPKLSWSEALLLAVILAPTDAALGQAVVTLKSLPSRVRQGLNVESGLNDGGSVPFLMLFIALAASHEGLEDGWLQFALEQIGYGTLIGAAVGAAGGVALRRAAERGWTVPVFEQLALASLAVIAWLLADQAGGNGFIAAFVGGAAAGMAAGALRDRVLEFTEDEGQILNLAVFFIFGVFAADALGEATWQMVAYAVLSLTVIRMLPVAIAVVGLGLSASTIAFLGWFGPRGLASIILALVVVEEEPGLAGIDQIFLVMTVTVLLSIFAHGVTAAPLTRRYARGVPAPSADLARTTSTPT
jgi:sodium/hydrogen antiporter